MRNIVDFIFELAQLKKIKRSGWLAANIDNPESVAEHSQRAAIVAYILAKLENADSETSFVFLIARLKYLSYISLHHILTSTITTLL